MCQLHQLHQLFSMPFPSWHLHADLLAFASLVHIFVPSVVGHRPTCCSSSSCIIVRRGPYETRVTQTACPVSGICPPCLINTSAQVSQVHPVRLSGPLTEEFVAHPADGRTGRNSQDPRRHAPSQSLPAVRIPDDPERFGHAASIPYPRI